MNNLSTRDGLSNMCADKYAICERLEKYALELKILFPSISKETHIKLMNQRREELEPERQEKEKINNPITTKLINYINKIFP